MKILAIGDTVGEPGRQVIARWVPRLRKEEGVEFVIVNAEKIKVTGKKLTDKIYQRYTGYPSGQREMTLGVMLKKSPAKALELAVTRMLPSGPLAYKQATKLKVYAGDKHPHAAQKPVVVEITK